MLDGVSESDCALETRKRYTSSSISIVFAGGRQAQFATENVGGRFAEFGGMGDEKLLNVIINLIDVSKN